MKTFTTKIFLLLTMTLVSSTIYAADTIIMPPANDLIENAINLNIGPSPYSESNVNFPEATSINDQTYSGNGCSLTQAAVWYKFTATKAGNVAAGILNPNGAVVVFFSGPENATNGNNLVFVNQNNNICDYSALGNIDTTAGTTYYIYMRNVVVSDVSINASAAFQAPANDLIENATNLNGLEDYFDDNVHFLVATNDGDSGQSGCDTDPVRAVWYKFTAAIDGQVVAGIDVAPAGGGVVFYTAADENATSGGDLTWVDQPNNPCGPNNLASINAVAGTTYYLLAGKIGAFANGYADVSINLSGILGIEDNVIDGFSFYPNPVTSEINLSATTTIDEVVIYNLLGQKVFAEKPNSTRKTIDMVSLQTGLYVMHVSSEGRSASYKIVKK
ncbi:putative secreted protein (Por secretion system target) [Ulvibacter sp. MAR_2010_11]|uniref:T9SS type A sorting domain-containing protein n=1 Tax=Ulvibacter sp. MAR_2010_11 TaxID=1250229 RepID=UPI000C2C5DF3|nr:T9SS type A sorting domain-containing protein [Ulvibacter sp. MAR_2010_11]PKA83910.1 putative secreted protein (Por secretion system target) [Ulvibacter sp. MAR_2010_11]